MRLAFAEWRVRGRGPDYVTLPDYSFEMSVSLAPISGNRKLRAVIEATWCSPVQRAATSFFIMF